MPARLAPGPIFVAQGLGAISVIGCLTVAAELSLVPNHHQTTSESVSGVSGGTVSCVSKPSVECGPICLMPAHAECVLRDRLTKLTIA